MLTSANYYLTSVRVRGKSTTMRGQPTYETFHLAADKDVRSAYGVPVFVDFRVRRLAAAFNRDTDIEATMEITSEQMRQVRTVMGRNLRTGDLIRFNEVKRYELDEQPFKDQLFVVGEESHEAGVFNSLGMHKFNLRRSDRRD